MSCSSFYPLYTQSAKKGKINENSKRKSSENGRGKERERERERVFLQPACQKSAKTNKERGREKIIAPRTSNIVFFFHTRAIRTRETIERALLESELIRERKRKPPALFFPFLLFVDGLPAHPRGSPTTTGKKEKEKGGPCFLFLRVISVYIFSFVVMSRRAGTVFS